MSQNSCAEAQKNIDSIDQPSSSESSDNEVACTSNAINVCKRQKFSRSYCNEWEVQFKWVKLDEETKRPICIVCKQLLINQKTHLARHVETKKHIDHLYKAKDTEHMQIDKFVLKQNLELKHNVAIAEIKLVIRMILKNQSFRSMDNITKLHTSIYPDSSIAKSVRI